MGNPAIPKRLKNKVLSLQRKDQRNSKKQTGFPQKGNALWKTRADLSRNRGKRDEPDGGDESPPYRGSGEKFPVPQFSGSGAKDAVPPIRPGLEFLRFLLCKEGTKIRAGGVPWRTRTPPGGGTPRWPGAWPGPRSSHHGGYNGP